MVVILTLLICCFLGSCLNRPEPQLIVLGDARVVGKIIEDQIIWHPAAMPNKANLHYIVTQGFIHEFSRFKTENILLDLEIKKLRELLEKK